MRTHRVYNGCPDDELQAILSDEASLFNQILAIEPEAFCTYFPIEGKFQVHKWGDPISKFHDTKLDALRNALDKLSAV